MFTHFLAVAAAATAAGSSPSSARCRWIEIAPGTKVRYVAQPVRPVCTYEWKRRCTSVPWYSCRGDAAPLRGGNDDVDGQTGGWSVGRWSVSKAGWTGTRLQAIRRSIVMDIRTCMCVNNFFFSFFRIIRVRAGKCVRAWVRACDKSTATIGDRTRWIYILWRIVTCVCIYVSLSVDPACLSPRAATAKCHWHVRDRNNNVDTHDVWYNIRTARWSRHD